MNRVPFRVAAVAATVALVASGCGDSSPTEPPLMKSFAAGGAQVVDDCTVITEPGKYVLGQDLVVDDRVPCAQELFPGFLEMVGIRIESGGVHLSLAGHTIYGDAAAAALGSGLAIRLANDIDDVHITDGAIEGGGLFFDGIQASGTNVRVTGMTIRDNSRFGIGSIFCGDCRYSGNTFTENGNAGIQTVFAGELGPTQISGNRFVDNGIAVTLAFFSGDVTIVGNVMTGNSIGGILDFVAPEGGNKIQGNTIADSGPNGGISLWSSDNVVRGNEVSNSAADGIALLKGGFFSPGDFPTSGNIVQGNVVTGSGGVDLRDGNDDPCANTWKSNTFETDSEGDGPQQGCIQ